MKFGFPGIIGCIDCTHVAIVSPHQQHPDYPEHLYINRKHYHSINVQLICDSNLRILNINARYPGSTNDAFIWNNSNVKTFMEQLHGHGENSFYLLGDSGYPLRPWLLTPLQYETQPNSPEDRYNNAHKVTRCTIERCNGVLKSRFRCLLRHRVLHYGPETASQITNACAVLHNICIANNVEEPELGEGDEHIDFGLLVNTVAYREESQTQSRRANPLLAEGRRIQRRLIQNYF
nr:unnamed protein product [Callosobruchus analis]